MTFQTKMILKTLGKIGFVLGSMFLVIVGACSVLIDPDQPEPTETKQEQVYQKPTEAVNEMIRYRYKNGEIGTLPNHPQAGRGVQIFK